MCFVVEAIEEAEFICALTAAARCRCSQRRRSLEHLLVTRLADALHRRPVRGGGGSGELAALLQVLVVVLVEPVERRLLGALRLRLLVVLLDLLLRLGGGDDAALDLGVELLEAAVVVIDERMQATDVHQARLDHR